MSETIRPFDAGNWFPIHNAVFDVIMPKLSPNGWKILCVAIRQTWGWRDPDSSDPRDRKRWDHITYSTFRERSGVRTDATVKRAIDECIEGGYLVRRQPVDKYGKPQTYRGKPYYEYALNRDYKLTSSKIKEVTSSKIEEVEPPTSSKIEESKQTYKKTTNKAAVAALSDDQRRALDALREIGFVPDGDAISFARSDPGRALEWATYARANGLGGGFVRKQLAAGNDPPSPSPQYPQSNGEVFR